MENKKVSRETKDMNISRFLLISTLGSSLLSLTGCVSIFSNTPQPSSLLNQAPAQIEESEEVKELLTQSSSWVSEFKSPQLDSLLNSTFSSNLSWKQVQRRLKQADLSVKIARAEQLPRIIANAGYSNLNSFSKTSSLSNTSNSSNRYSVGGALSWELDFWGRVKSQKLLALAEYEQTQASYKRAALLLSSELTNNYFNLITQKELLELQEQQTKYSQEVLDLTKQKQELGLGNKLDIIRQQQQLAGLKVSRAGYLNTYHQTLHAIAVLIGKEPTNYSLDINQELPKLRKLPKIKNQESLIITVPGLLEAYSQIVVDRQSLAISISNRLPRFILSANYELSSSQSSFNLYDQIANFAVNMSQTVFDYGELKNLNKQAVLELENSVLAFQEQYLITLEDLENALTQEKYFKQTWEFIQEQEQLAEQSFEEACRLYATGDSEFIDVLDSLSSWQDLQQQEILANRNVLNSRVQLYIALGGN